MADVLGKKFGYVVYDADTDIPNHMRRALLNKEIITDSMRREFLDRMIASVGKLIHVHPKLAIHQTFIKEFMRREFLAAFRHAQFILVECQDALREQRYMKRQYFNLGLAYLRHMSELFEKPSISHNVIYNNEDGSEKIMQQLKNTIIRGNP